MTYALRALAVLYMLGRTFDATVRRAASAWASEDGLEVLDPSGLRSPWVWTSCPLVLLPAFALDLAPTPILDRRGWTTNFGVLARRRP